MVYMGQGPCQRAREAVSFLLPTCISTGTVQRAQLRPSAAALTYIHSCLLPATYSIPQVTVGEQTWDRASKQPQPRVITVKVNHGQEWGEVASSGTRHVVTTLWVR